MKDICEMCYKETSVWSFHKLEGDVICREEGPDAPAAETKSRVSPGYCNLHKRLVLWRKNKLKPTPPFPLSLSP